nr:odorant-binding protein 22 [Peridroma saucia]
MIRSCSGLVLVAVFQVIFGQAPQGRPSSSPGFQRQTLRVPEHCLAPPPGVDLHKCCPIPKLFSDEAMDRCGIDKMTKEELGKPSKPKIPCQESYCLMRNANMLRENKSVDYEELRAFIDKWAEVDPDFTVPISSAKMVCAKDGGPSGPPVCEPDRIFICLTSNVLWNCKLQNIDDNGGCKILKEHMDECRPYYWSPSEQVELESRKSQ